MCYHYFENVGDLHKKRGWIQTCHHKRVTTVPFGIKGMAVSPEHHSVLRSKSNNSQNEGKARNQPTVFSFNF